MRSDLKKVPGLPSAQQAAIAANISDFGGGDAAGRANPQIGVIVANGIADASTPAAVFAGLVVLLGALFSTLVPNIPPDAHPGVLLEGAGAREA